jgi:hypothetical protein
MKSTLAALVLCALVAAPSSAADRMVVYDDKAWSDLVQLLDSARHSMPLSDMSKLGRVIDQLATAQTVIERKEETKEPAKEPPQ